MARWIALVALLAGCAGTAEVQKPPPAELPAAWKEAAPPRGPAEGPWWRVYRDATLEALIGEALKGNADLLVAAARVDEARALLGETRSGLYPQVSGQAGATRQHTSERTAFSPPGAPREYSTYRATVNVSWEIDLFGRLAAGTRAARAELEASEASREAVRLLLAAQVAKSYFALRALDEQAALMRQTVALRDDALVLQRRRYEGGVLSQFELRQLEAEAAVARAQLPPLEREREREETALAVLLGRTPAEVFGGRVVPQDAAEALMAPVLPSGLPSELLLRRPDLVEAERRLAAANARIEVARREMFPSIALTAGTGFESAQLADLFTGPAGIWSIGASLLQPIFSGGRLEARTDAARARERAVLAQYAQAIRNAFGEVRIALAAQARSRESFDAESARAAALTETLRLARLRYQSGVSSQLEVIDAERGLLAAQSARIDALRAHRAAIADLYRALGG